MISNKKNPQKIKRGKRERKSPDRARRSIHLSSPISECRVDSPNCQSSAAATLISSTVAERVHGKQPIPPIFFLFLFLLGFTQSHKHHNEDCNLSESIALILRHSVSVSVKGILSFFLSFFRFIRHCFLFFRHCFLILRNSSVFPENSFFIMLLQTYLFLFLRNSFFIMFLQRSLSVSQKFFLLMGLQTFLFCFS